MVVYFYGSTRRVGWLSQQNKLHHEVKATARVRFLTSLLNCIMVGRPEIYILLLAHGVFLDTTLL
jgi:hypothetical protein